MKIKSIRKVNKTQDRFDLSVQNNHNYFVNGMLVHNSNSAFCHDGDKLWIKSRNFYKKMDPDDMWCEVAIRYELEKKLALFPNMVFFGEIYGQVKGYHYDAKIVNGKLQPNIRFFDILNIKSNRYLDYDDRVAMIKSAGLDPVPELYRGPWTTKEEIYKLAEGQSTLNSKHLREGWVLNTVKERFEPKLNSRMQVKLVSEAYNLSK